MEAQLNSDNIASRATSLHREGTHALRGEHFSQDQKPAIDAPPPARHRQQRMATAQTRDTHSVDYIVRSGFAGGVAGCSAKTVIAPLDRVKILFQTGEPMFKKYRGRIIGLPLAAQHIWRTEGPLGLFRGHSATLARVFPYAAIKFVAYEQIRAVLIPSKSYETHIRRFLAGSFAGVGSVMCTYPLEVVRVRLAYTGSRPEVAHARHRLFGTIASIWHQSAATPVARIKNFYPGFGATLLGIIPYAGVSFFAHDIGHDIFRSRMLRNVAVNYKISSPDNRHPLKGWAELIAGGTSGIIAQTASYPLEVIRRRMQVGGITGASRTLRSTAQTIYKELGMKGFFVGLSIGYIKVAPMFACSFYVYEQMKYLLQI